MGNFDFINFCYMWVREGLAGEVFLGDALDGVL